MKLYNLTLQRPGGITHVIHGNFSGPKQQEIIVSRGCVLEVLKPDPSTGKIHTLLTCNVFGIIRALHPIRLTGSNRGIQNKLIIIFQRKNNIFYI
jgi:splicing factor 3B subunit 3